MNPQPSALNKYKVLSGTTLKAIAVITMLIDHIGAAFVCALPIFIANKTSPLWEGSPFSYYDFYMLLRQIGRTAFPIFCFLIVEGFVHTHNRKAYASRLFIFAILSEIPFDLAIKNKLFYFGLQNVFFTLFLGLIAVIAIDSITKKLISKGVVPDLARLCSLVSSLLIILIATVLKTDYAGPGVALIIIFYILHEKTILACIVGYISFIFEPFCLPAFLLIPLYNQKRGLTHIGPFSLKYIFYFFYPVHLLVIYFFRVILLKV